jgi:hypothetical protein
VVVTLALGIGANAAIFSVVRGVLLRPLVNRDEERLIYIRQSAQGIGADNANVLGPGDPRPAARVTTLSGFGDFSHDPFTMVGLGEPRVVRAGVVGGSYFDVMGLRRCSAACSSRRRRAERGRRRGADLPLLDDDARQRPSVIGKTVGSATAGDDRRRARAVGAVSGGNRDHRQLWSRARITCPRRCRTAACTDVGAVRALAPGVELDAARAELRAVHAAMVTAHPSRIRRTAIPHRRRPPARSDHRPRRGPCCWCCWRRRRWSSSSRARTSPT